MLSYFCRKLSFNVATLFVIVTLTFFLMKAIPGDPFTQEKALPKEIHEALRQHYGLEDPLALQYVRYLSSLIQWNLGPSFTHSGRTVNEIINSGFPISALLGLEALAIAICLGIPLGILAAAKHNRWQDFSILTATAIGSAAPNFILATFLQYLLAFKLGWFPIARWGSFMHTVLPALSLAIFPAAFIARLIRSNMIEVLKQGYIKTAKAKGVAPLIVFFHHGLRNAILPVFTYLGQLTASILMGSFVVEKIFSIPGLGYWFVSSITNRDYTVIMGITVFYSIIMLSALTLVEIAYGVIDPRIRTYNAAIA